MLLALSKRYGENERANDIFPTVDLLPALCVPHEPKLLLLTSLHAHGQIFGYLATTYDTADKIQADEFYINWCDAVMNGLYSLQQHIVAEQMKAQIALLTVHDPETELSNPRGLAEHLPEMLRTAHRNQTTAHGIDGTPCFPIPVAKQLSDHARCESLARHVSIAHP